MAMVIVLIIIIGTSTFNEFIEGCKFPKKIYHNNLVPKKSINITFVTTARNNRESRLKSSLKSGNFFLSRIIIGRITNQLQLVKNNAVVQLKNKSIKERLRNESLKR